MNINKSFLFVVLSSVSATFCMEQAVVKYRKCMPNHVYVMLNPVQHDREQWDCSYGRCARRFTLNAEQKWRALICATYYEDSVSVKNLLEGNALDKDTLTWTRNDQLNLYSSVEAFPRLHVLPLTIALHIKNQDIIALLKNKSDLQDIEMCPLYALAVYMGDIDLLDQCIKNNDFDALYNDKTGGGLLQLAVRNGDDNMVNRLLQAPDIKASINSWRFDCAPVLFIAAQRGFYNIAKQLCAAGADPVISYRHPHSLIKSLPITEAIWKKHADIVKLFCEQSADLANTPDDHGNTALHIAAKNGDEDAVKVLLAVSTIKVDIKNNYGGTPLTIAQEKRHYKCECLLWRWLDKNRSTQ